MGLRERVVSLRQWLALNRGAVANYGMAAFEVAYFGGLPLFAVFAVATITSVSLLVRAAVASVRPARAARLWLVPPGLGLAVVTVGAMGTMVALSLYIGTPEAARLWQFLFPYICIG